MKKDPDESKATEEAIGIVRNWAEGHDGHGHKVSADVQAAAAKNIAAYEALRARAKATPNKGRHDMSHPYAGGLLQPGQWVGEAGPTLIKFDKPNTVHSHAVTSAAVDAYQAATVDLAAPWDPNKHPRGGKGSAAGGKFVPIGTARDSKAQKAQADTGSRHQYDKTIRATGNVRTADIKGLSDGKLQALTRTAYSFKSSDPNVVKLRIAVANEMAKRGFDVKDFGALGGGINSDKGKTPAKAAPKKAAVKKSAALAALARVAKHGTAAQKTAARAAMKKKGGSK
jgi:hypothetical protein